MIIRWLDEAVADLQALHRYIAEDNQLAAKRITHRLVGAINLLADQPGIGRPGRVINTRELIVAGTPYFIPYRVNHNQIEILRVLHCARQWPENALIDEVILEVNSD